jgi:hypothetical protein
VERKAVGFAERYDRFAETSRDKVKDFAKTAAAQCSVAVAAAKTPNEIERLTGFVRAAEEAIRQAEETVTKLEGWRDRHARVVVKADEMTDDIKERASRGARREGVMNLDDLVRLILVRCPELDESDLLDLSPGLGQLVIDAVDELAHRVDELVEAATPPQGTGQGARDGIEGQEEAFAA